MLIQINYGALLQHMALQIMTFFTKIHEILCPTLTLHEQSYLQDLPTIFMILLCLLLALYLSISSTDQQTMRYLVARRRKCCLITIRKSYPVIFSWIKAINFIKNSKGCGYQKKLGRPYQSRDLQRHFPLGEILTT